MPGPKIGTPNLREPVHMDRMEISQKQFYERTYRGKKSRPKIATCSVCRQGAFEMHMDISEEQVYSRIYRKKRKPDAAP